MVYFIYILTTIILGIAFQLFAPRTHKKYYYMVMYVTIIFVFGWIIMGFRGLHVGKDTFNYYNNYFHIIKLPFRLLFNFRETSLEPIWCLLMWITNFFNGNYLIFQLIISAIICSLSAKLIIQINKLLPGYHITITICLYLCYFYLISLNISRQIIAALLIANSWFYYINKSYGKSLCYFSLALGFHYSCVTGIPLFIMWILRKNKYFFSCFFIALISFAISIHTLMGMANKMGMYVNYTNADAHTFQEANSVKALWVLTGVICTWIILKKKTFALIARICSAYSLIYVILNFLSSEVSYIERIAIYYEPFVIISLIVFGNTFKSQNIKLVYYSGMLTCYSFWFIISSGSGQYVYSINELL